ncbi:MAG: YbaB/EbfC family nucleoid-associated protein [Actinocatenispora sp.]
MRADWQAHIDELMDQYRTMRDNVSAMQEQVREIVGTAESEDGLVRASVGYRGDLSGLEIDPRVLRSYDSLTLSETILAVAQAATTDLRRQMTETMSPYLPESLGDLGGIEKQVDLKRLLPEDPTDPGRLRPPR